MLRTIAGAFTVLALTAQAPATAPVQQPPSSTATCPEMATALQGLMRNDARLRDWPLLSRYRDANATLGDKGNGNRVVFMGDSITDAWPARFASSFFPGKPYVGRGISGQTTPQMLIRFRPDVIALKPKAVVILAGTNDIAGNTGPMTNEEIQGNLQSMAELAKANGIKVVLASIMPTGAYHTAAGAVPQLTLRPMARIIAINDWMKKYAGDNGHVYLDYFSAMIDSTGVMKRELTTDDLHPNAAGYEIMAPLAQAAIDKALK
jgi:lysophospholipase L1-like esterase